MTERPILFSGPMVRALPSGSKTQTRRAYKAGNGGFWPNENDRPGMRQILRNCPYGHPGDRLLVKETHYAWGHWTKRYNAKKKREEWHFVDETIGTGKAYRYDADERLPRRKRELHEVGWWKRPAIFMPRAAIRILLEVTGVRLERLQDISESDAIAEGIERLTYGGITTYRNYALSDDSASVSPMLEGPIESYRTLWESINGPGSWDANPWVWVIEFKRVEKTA